MNDPSERRRLLESLIGLKGNIEHALTILRHSDHAGVTSAVQIDRSSIRRAIGGFEKGAVSSDLLERWAEAIHSTDEVMLDPSDEAFLSETLFKLSTPELFGSMESIVAEIRRQDRDLNDHNEP